MGLIPCRRGQFKGGYAVDPCRPSSRAMIHLPPIYRHGYRYRPRVRWLRRWRGLHRHRDVSPDGTVWRVWIGWVLITVMID